VFSLCDVIGRVVDVIIAGIICALLAIGLGIYSSYAFRCKGPLISNPWLWMSKEERERELAKVDIRAEYRQVAIVFVGLALIVGYFAVLFFSDFVLPMYPLWIIIGLIVVYAIGSSMKFVKNYWK